MLALDDFGMCKPFIKELGAIGFDMSFQLVQMLKLCGAPGTYGLNNLGPSIAIGAFDERGGSLERGLIGGSAVMRGEQRAVVALTAGAVLMLVEGGLTEGANGAQGVAFVWLDELQGGAA